MALFPASRGAKAIIPPEPGSQADSATPDNPTPEMAAPPSSSIPAASATPSATLRRTGADISISVPLTIACREWPAAICEETAHLPPDAVIHFPVVEVAAARRRGFALFSWRDIRSWIDPKLHGESLYDAAMLRIPAHALEVSPPSAQAPSGVGESAKPAPLGPAQIIEGCCALDSVCGAIVINQDGAVLAARLPGHLNPSTVAEHLHRIYESVEEGAKAAGVGALEQLAFTGAGSPWEVIRAGVLITGVLGFPDQALPVGQIKGMLNNLPWMAAPTTPKQVRF